MFICIAEFYCMFRLGMKGYVFSCLGNIATWSMKRVVDDDFCIGKYKLLMKVLSGWVL